MLVKPVQEEDDSIDVSGMMEEDGEVLENLPAGAWEEGFHDDWDGGFDDNFMEDMKDDSMEPCGNN